MLLKTSVYVQQIYGFPSNIYIFEVVLAVGSEFIKNLSYMDKNFIESLIKMNELEMMLKGYSKVKAIAFEGKVALMYAHGTMASAVLV